MPLQHDRRILFRAFPCFGIFVIFLFQFLPLISVAQTQPAAHPADTTSIEIRQADFLEIIQYRNESINRLVHHVVLAQKDVLLNCDSALLFRAENRAKIYGHVRIMQGDSIFASGDSAVYDGNADIATLYSNVKLTDNTMTLSTKVLIYDAGTGIATYLEGGTVDDGESILTSDLGYYYEKTNDAYFKRNVTLHNPDYDLSADTLQYNTQIRRAYFHGPTIIRNKESTVHCSGGYYDTDSGTAVFNDHVHFEDPPQQLLADSIYYDRQSGIGKAYRDILFTDTSRHVLQYARFAVYNELTNSIVAMGRSVAGYIVQDDTLFIAGDTIRSMEDSMKKRSMIVYPNVQIFKSDLQGACDSLAYADLDSTIRMYGIPVLWSDSTQFSADTVFMRIQNKQLSEMEMHSRGFIINEDDSLLYNQIKGRLIFGYFTDEELRKIQVNGNAESIYYGKDDKNAYIGVNKTVCSHITILVEDRKFRKVSFLGAPSAEFHPMSQVHPSDYLLDDFDWRYPERPKSKQDLLQGMNPYAENAVENPR